MHPVIRIISFIVLTAFLAQGDAANILVATMVLAFLFIKLDGQSWRTAWRLLRRMRWLFLSIAVIYLWLTPGVPLIPGMPSLAEWLPTVEGLWQGGLRIISLALMVTAASLLLSVTSRDEVLGALHWMMAPLGRLLRFPHERFAVRAALSLEAVTRVQAHVRAALAAGGESAGPLARIGSVAGAIFGTVTGEAEGAACEPIMLNEQSAPPLTQWGLPLLLAVTMMASMQLIG
jgi:energy-coupling factor transporter transmembrane protein EcfT